MYALFTAIPLVGHVNPLLRQAEELQRRGWRVAFAGAREIRAHVAAESPGLPFVDLGELGPIADQLRRDQEAASIDRNFVRGTFRILSGLAVAWPVAFDGLTASIAGDRPDLVVTDFFTSAGMCAAEAAQVPFVVNNPDLLASLPITMLPPADHLPRLFSGRSVGDVGWTQRAAAPLLRRLAAAISAATIGRQLNALRRSRGLAPTTVDDLLRGRLILVNGAFGIEYERPLPPLVEMVGAMLPPAIPPLPPDLDAWLADGPPVVYVNLGTLAVALPSQLAKMAGALGAEGMRALWILRAPQAAALPRPLPAGLRVMAWGPPPLAVLSHPNVKAFVTHAGINSAHEAVTAGTPIVAIPMFADQRDMAARMTDAGIGLRLDKTRFSAAELREAVLRVLREPSFPQRMPAAQAALAKAGGVRRAVDLIERHPARRS